jgi:glycogen operon protein
VEFARSSLRSKGSLAAELTSTATGIDLLVFDHVDDAKPRRVVSLNAVANRTYHATGTCSWRA